METVTKSLLSSIVLLLGASFVSAENVKFGSGDELTLERQLRSSDYDDSEDYYSDYFDYDYFDYDYFDYDYFDYDYFDYDYFDYDYFDYDYFDFDYDYSDHDDSGSEIT